MGASSSVVPTDSELSRDSGINSDNTSTSTSTTIGTRITTITATIVGSSEATETTKAEGTSKGVTLYVSIGAGASSEATTTTKAEGTSRGVIFYVSIGAGAGGGALLLILLLVCICLCCRRKYRTSGKPPSPNSGTLPHELQYSSRMNLYDDLCIFDVITIEALNNPNYSSAGINNPQKEECLYAMTSLVGENQNAMSPTQSKLLKTLSPSVSGTGNECSELEADDCNKFKEVDQVHIDNSGYAEPTAVCSDASRRSRNLASTQSQHSTRVSQNEKQHGEAEVRAHDLLSSICSN